MASVCFVDVVLRAPTCGFGPGGHFGGVCPPTSAGRPDQSSRTCLSASWCALCWKRGERGAWPGARCLLTSWKPPSFKQVEWRVKGGLGCTSGLLEQKVLEHGLLGVPLAEVLPLSGPGFLYEVPVLHLRFRLLSPSPSKPLVCRPVSGVAPRGLRPWPCCGG